MNTAELIYQKAKEIPDNEAREVLDFMERLRAKREREAASVGKGENENPVTSEEHAAWVEQMRAITATQPMTYTTVEDMRQGARY